MKISEKVTVLQDAVISITQRLEILESKFQTLPHSITNPPIERLEKLEDQMGHRTDNINHLVERLEKLEEQVKDLTERLNLTQRLANTTAQTALTIPVLKQRLASITLYLK